MKNNFDVFKQEYLYGSYKEGIDDNLEYSHEYSGYKCKQTGRIVYDRRDCLHCGECIKSNGSKRAKKQYNYMLYCANYRKRF